MKDKFFSVSLLFIIIENKIIINYTMQWKISYKLDSSTFKFFQFF